MSKLVDGLQGIVDGATTVEALKQVLDQIIRAGDAQEGIHSSVTLVMCKQTRLALDEVE